MWIKGRRDISFSTSSTSLNSYSLVLWMTCKILPILEVSESVRVCWACWVDVVQPSSSGKDRPTLIRYVWNLHPYWFYLVAWHGGDLALKCLFREGSTIFQNTKWLLSVLKESLFSCADSKIQDQAILRLQSVSALKPHLNTMFPFHSFLQEFEEHALMHCNRAEQQAGNDSAKTILWLRK